MAQTISNKEPGEGKSAPKKKVLEIEPFKKLDSTMKLLISSYKLKDRNVAE